MYAGFNVFRLSIYLMCVYVCIRIRLKVQYVRVRAFLSGTMSVALLSLVNLYFQTLFGSEAGCATFYF